MHRPPPTHLERVGESFKVPYTIINAFPSSPHFSGNRCPVILFPSAITKTYFPDETLRLIAEDWGMAEVAFIFHRPEAKGREDEWDVRFWTDAMEPKLCGHATFSSAHHLFSLHPHLSVLTLRTISGPYVATRLPNNTTQITLPSADFLPCPSDPRHDLIVAATCAGFGWSVDRATQEGLIKFVGVSSGEGAKKGRYDYESFALVEVDGGLLEGGLEGVNIEGGAFATLPSSLPILVVTSRPPPSIPAPQADFISRVFNSPLIDSTSFEDPVTGTAHAGVLAPYWSNQLLSPQQQEEGKTELVARQVSRRGGGMRVCWNGKAAGEGGWTDLRSEGVKSGEGWMLVPISGTPAALGE